jgi:hypothetical protein
MKKLKKLKKILEDGTPPTMFSDQIQCNPHKVFLTKLEKAILQSYHNKNSLVIAQKLICSPME